MQNIFLHFFFHSKWIRKQHHQISKRTLTAIDRYYAHTYSFTMLTHTHVHIYTTQHEHMSESISVHRRCALSKNAVWHIRPPLNHERTPKNQNYLVSPIVYNTLMHKNTGVCIHNHRHTCIQTIRLLLLRQFRNVIVVHCRKAANPICMRAKIKIITIRLELDSFSEYCSNFVW